MRPLAPAILLTICLPAMAFAQGDVWTAPDLGEERHPCLLFSEAEIPTIKERLTRPPYSGWWGSIERNDGNMVYQAFTWLMTGDEAKAAAARERLLNAYPSGYHCACGVADPLQGMAEAYDLLYGWDGLSADDHRIIRAKLAAACERMYLCALESGAGQHPGNQRTRGICALGTAALVLRGYEDSAHTPQQWLQRALDSIHEDRNLEFWRDDGMFIEGPGYSSFTLSIMLPFARYYDNVAGKWLFDDPRLENAILYLIYITQPDGLCAAIGTTNSLGLAQTLRQCIGAGDPEVQAMCRWALEEWGYVSSGGLRDIALFDETVRPSTGGFPTTRFYPVTQEAHFRSAWSRHAVALWFKGKDPWLAATHRVYSHGDVGSFVLHAFGELLAVDAGYDHWVSYDLYPPVLHNTLLVDGEGPVNETPGLLVDALDADFVQSGAIESEFAGVKHRREFIFVDRRYVIIADEITALEQHDYQWQIHTPVSRHTGDIALDGPRASWTGFDPRSDSPGDVAVQCVWAGPVQVEPMENSRWQPFSADPKTGSYDNWALVAKQSGTNARYLTVLYPHPKDVEPPAIEIVDLPRRQCIRITHADGATDTLLASAANAPPMGATTTTATTCVLRETRDARLDWVWMSAPGTFTHDGDEILRVTDTAHGAVALDALASRAWSSDPAGIKLALRGAPIAATVAGTARPPTLAAVAVDGEARPPREITDLSRVVAAPKTATFGFTPPAGEDLDRATLLTQLNGRDLPPAYISGEGDVVEVSLPADLPQTNHELVVRVANRSAPRSHSQALLKFSLSPLLLNGGFEMGGERPTGWSLGAWSSNADTKYDSRAVRDNPHSGQWCLMMKGVAGALNMVASQRVQVTLGKTYICRGYHRGDVASKVSFCSQSGKNQYIYSPTLPPSEEWRSFEWEFTVENPEATLLLAMRLGQVGTVYFDDVSLDEVEPNE